MRLVTNKEQRDRLRRNDEKWSKELMSAGWTAFPSVLLERQKALGLDAMDVNIILHLARHWWRADNPPHPSKKAIAACMGVDVSTIRKRIQRLERDGLIRREARYGPAGRQRTNCYHFDGLIESAKPYAAEATRTRDQRRKEDQERRTRKRADLTVVKAAAPARGRR